jgi:hypothetical protein
LEIATAGSWDGNSIALEGQATPQLNHAKIGVSTGAQGYAIFGDLKSAGVNVGT